VAIGFLILAWRLLPAPDWHPMSKVMAFLPAFLGAALFIDAVTRSPRKATPWWQGVIGRLLVVLIAWGVIISAAQIYGTPHLIYRYPPREPTGTCVYLGWRGVIKVSTYIQGTLNGCDIIRLL
jgi:hypothetical protein